MEAKAEDAKELGLIDGVVAGLRFDPGDEVMQGLPGQHTGHPEKAQDREPAERHDVDLQNIRDLGRGGQAQGVTSGGQLTNGNDNCSASTPVTWFQPVREILSRYNLRLVR